MRAKRVKKLEELSGRGPGTFDRVETIMIKEGEDYTPEQKKLIEELEDDPRALLIIRTIVSPKE